MKLAYKMTNIVRGGLIYTLGDTTAALLSNEFSWWRVLGILLIGSTIYAFEIPNYFSWIDKKVNQSGGVASLKRTGLAMLYFNPLWIARHILFIKLISSHPEQIHWGLLEIGLISFVVNIPISLLANFLIQNKIKLEWRFMASAIFSAIMAVYYALSAIWFS